MIFHLTSPVSLFSILDKEKIILEKNLVFFEIFLLKLLSLVYFLAYRLC